MSSDLGAQIVANVATFLNDKPWFKSVTVWGLIIFAAFSAGASEACTQGMLGEGACAVIAKVGQYVGGAMVVLGLRRSTGQATAAAAESKVSVK